MWIWKPTEKKHIEFVIVLKLRFLDQDILVMFSLSDYLFFENWIKNRVYLVFDSDN